MVPGLLADVNIEGHFTVLLAACSGGAWGEWWAELQVPVYTFAGLGLSPDTPDGEILGRLPAGLDRPGHQQP